MYTAFWKFCEVYLSDLSRASQCVSSNDGSLETGHDGFSPQLLRNRLLGRVWQTLQSLTDWGYSGAPISWHPRLFPDQQL